MDGDHQMMTDEDHWKKLPPELHFEIFKHFDTISQFRARRVSKRWDSLLRDPSLFKMVKLDAEGSNKQFFQNTERIAAEVVGLSKAGVWKQAEVIILDGDYDMYQEEPHDGFWPFAMSAMLHELGSRISDSISNQDGNFQKLHTMILRKTSMNLASLKGVDNMFKFKLIFVDSSIAFHNYNPAAVEIEIRGTKVFDLSGKTFGMDLDPEVHWAENGPYWRCPKEIAEFMMEQRDAVSQEAVSKLGEVYSDLLKGRPRMLMRFFVKMIFDIDLHRYKRMKPYWEHCREFNFNNIRAWAKYALVYYSRPRNCYVVGEIRSKAERERAHHKDKVL